MTHSHESAYSYHVSQDGRGNFARGAFGEITLAVRHSGEVRPDLAISFQQSFVGLVAIKTVYLPQGDRHSEDYLSEISCLQLLGQHPNIVRLLDAFANRVGGGNGQWWSMVLPYCPVDLYTALEWKRCTLQPMLSQKTLCRIASHLFAALEHCHKMGVIHADVKPGNLLIHVESGALQLCDFGIAQKEIKASLLITMGEAASAAPLEGVGTFSDSFRKQPRALCTLQYRPPELLLGMSPSECANSALDVFSAGVTLAECVSGQMIFPGANDLAQLSLYFQCLGTPSEETWPNVVNLRDWGKLTFASHPSDPLWYRRMLPRLAEIPEDGPLTRVIVNTIKLDPSQRWPAKKCHQQLINDQAEETIHSRMEFVSELVPLRLQKVPLLLSPPCDCFDELDRQIESVARTRRDFIPSLYPWMKLIKK